MTPCAGCPSPILAGAPRFSELVISDFTPPYGYDRVDEYHPGCWAAELRRTKATP